MVLIFVGTRCKSLPLSHTLTLLAAMWKALLIILCVFWIIRVIARLIIRSFIAKAMRNGGVYTWSSTGGGFGQRAARPEGDIRVESPRSSQSSGRKPASGQKDGEYVDYEVVE